MLGRAIGNHVKELRFHLSQSSPASFGTRSICSNARDFLLKNYPGMKKLNPELPILIREAQEVEARIYCRYGTQQLTAGKGVEKSVSVEGLSVEDVESKVNTLLAAK